MEAARQLHLLTPDEGPGELASALSLARAPSEWDRALTQRLHGLLVAGPLLQLHRNDSFRANGPLGHYDSLAIAVKAFDLIIENAGLADELDVERLVRALTPLLVRMDRAANVEPDPTRHRDIVLVILEWLRNDSADRAPFQEDYLDLGSGADVRRTFRFRLVEDRFRPDGQIVLRLTDAAVNLFLRALGDDIEDAQHAAEAVLEYQLRRGKFNEAVASARTASLQSQRFQHKIEAILHETRRDVRTVDWRRDVPRLLDEAYAHIEARETVEQAIMRTASERLAHLAPGSADALNVAHVHVLIRECYMRHQELAHEIRRARPIFLEEQARQAFRPVLADLLPHLVEDALVPLMSMRAPNARSVLDDAFAGFVGLQVPAIIDLGQLIEWQLRPRRAAPAEMIEQPTRDLYEVGADTLLYPVALQEEGDRVLEALSEPLRLSDLVVRLVHDGAPARLVEYIVLRAYRDFAPEPDDGPRVRVSRLRGETFDHCGFAGDELMLHPTR
jgi:hypothetical protein